MQHVVNCCTNKFSDVNGTVEKKYTNRKVLENLNMGL